MPSTDPSPADPGTTDGSALLWAWLATGVRLRTEKFGAIAYAPHRDHFYALDAEHAAVLGGLREGPRIVRAPQWDMLVAMAAAGLCRTSPPTPERAFYGRSQFGALSADPLSVGRPMVINCFTTAHCPLRCTYCHADDLMTGYRRDEQPDQVRKVIRVARATPAMVGVVTGGEPLLRPDAAVRLIASLAVDKAVVLDTSGVGDLGPLLPHLHKYGVHVRVSLDSAEQAVNDRLRPINRRYLPLGASSFRSAWDSIRLLRREGLGFSVQTVVTAQNADLDKLVGLRNALREAGVRTWTLHVVVRAGKAAHAPRLSPGDEAVATLAKLVDRTAADRVPIDIRVTSTHRAPNSTLLVTTEGELAVQHRDGTDKTVRAVGRLFPRWSVQRQFDRYVDPAGHAGRYLNGTLDLLGGAAGGVMP